MNNNSENFNKSILNMAFTVPALVCVWINSNKLSFPWYITIMTIYECISRAVIYTKKKKRIITELRS